MKLNMFRTQWVWKLIMIYLGLVHSWDIAVSVGDELSFYTNATLSSYTKFESQNLTALAYAETHDLMLYVDRQTNGDTICRYSLSLIVPNACTYVTNFVCLTERTGRTIHGVAFDPIGDTVYFTDTNERTINWFSLKPGSADNVEGNLLLKLEEGIPRDIVVDSCRGYIYWLNTDMTKTTIERARFSGTERKVVEYTTSVRLNATHKLEPHSLALDQQTQTIHWFEPISTTEYHMGHSELNRINKTLRVRYDLIDIPLFMHPSNTLTVSNEFLFSVDFRPTRDRVYYIYKKTFNLDAAQYINVPANIDVGIVANYKLEDQIQGRHDCEGLRRKIKIPTECEATFCVYGVKVDEQSVCKCSPGYIGERCDVSVCENYCLRGSCSVNGNGLPECRCPAGYSGVRCEINLCHGYCLNGGACSLNKEEEPVCQCAFNYEGTRCGSDKRETLHCILLRGGASISD